eukprot:TRINITY_DN1279_c0_g1_i1.p1 TRINITY_DN1279_c0_g1~~TRINITY_DN1279_c0_g1_i1.p1  ORF type:complete len:516 (-),score=138.94 TRINITY_DN1279_c0_g1_i1:16-1563(-)
MEDPVHEDSLAPCVVETEEVKSIPDHPTDHLDDSNCSLPIEEDHSYDERYDLVGVPMSRLEEHIQYLLQRTDSNDYTRNGFDDEFAYIEHETTQDQYFGDYTSAMDPANKNKNRYSNVLPTERTRVKLTKTQDDESDFINANFINGLIPGSERAYIATQGPLGNTFYDFWRMIWELQVTVIVMLTREIENDRIKCDRYWPDPDCPLTCGNFKVILTDIEETYKDELLTRRFTIQNIDTEEEKHVVQLQYIAWPDHGIPVSTTAFLDLIDEADSYNPFKTPIVVHCSAGIGRSGTFCAVHSTIEKLKMELQQIHDTDTWHEPMFNIPQTVMYMRSQRPGMVQTKEQYMFVYLTILEKIREIFAHLTPTGNVQVENQPQQWSDNEGELSSSSEDETDEARSRSSSQQSQSGSKSGTQSPFQARSRSGSLSQSPSLSRARAHSGPRSRSGSRSGSGTMPPKDSEPKDGEKNLELKESEGSATSEPSIIPVRRPSVDVNHILEEVNHVAQVKAEPKEAE